MAAPTYATDLTDIDLAESITGWQAVGGGAAGISTGPDFSMQGAVCVDKQITAAEKGQIFGSGTTLPIAAADHILTWVFLATPGLANNLSSRGLAIRIGNSTVSYMAFHVEGADTYGAAGRVGKCYAVSYTTVGSAVAPFRTTASNPTTAIQYFGATANITGAVKGPNLGVDAIRYGTGIYITGGDVTTSATFGGIAAQNDSSANRWGIVSAIGGTFEMQGYLVIGQTSAGTTAAARFVDSNQVVSFVDTAHATTDFTRIVVDDGATVFNLTNVTFLALGTANPGRLTYNSTATVSSLVNVTFDGMGPTVLRDAVVARDCTWRDAGQITQNRATLTGCRIANSIVATSILSNDPARISSCTFESDGSNHAVEINTIGTFAFAGNNFTGYSTVNGAGGNEVIYNNSGGQVTLQASGGSGFISVRNAAGSSTAVETAVTATFRIVDANGNLITDACELTVTRNVDDVQLFTEDGIIDGITAYSYTSGAGTLTYVVVLNTANFQNKVINNYTLPSANETVTIQLDDELYYSNP